MQKGIGGSAGYGVGRVVIISNSKPEYVVKTVTDTEAEVKRYETAAETFEKRTQEMAEAMRDRVGDHNAEILEGHILLLRDPGMEEIVKSTIRNGTCAEAAFESACDMFSQMFQMTGDEMLKQRVTDINDIRMRMLKILTGTPDCNIAEVPAGTILVAEDLTPSMTAGIVKENVAGILTAVGGKTSHSAILARALQIPAVLGISGIVSMVHDGMEVAIDGCDGECILEPTEQEKTAYLMKRADYLKQLSMLQIYKGKETLTGDGRKVQLFANIGSTEDAGQVLACDGEGIGLFRTEFLFMGASELPTEEEQFQAYKKVAELMQGKSVIIRTLDVGGDKDIPYLKMEKEENPFLGFRAVRYCLSHEEVYRVQLRALLRASAFGDIKIMVPLVTSVEEMRAVKALLHKLMEELDCEGRKYNKNIRVGAMIETPAACLIADLLAKEADFFSIGTNDLTQYTMAVDRGNAKVSYLYSVYHPAVLRAIRHIIQTGKEAGIPVGMCGEAAADPQLIPLLISFGLDEYSVSATSILATRGTIAKWTGAEADKLAEEALLLSTEKEVEELLRKRSL
ncbi:MAG: phosphoenolpyruvate--protein phosphotransferase [Lachnospiraceae bacterium]